MNSTYPVVLLTRLTKNDLIFDEQEKWKYECTACPFRSNHITNFALHRRDHVGALEYSCEKCDKTFSERSDMKSHYDETHAVRRLHTCDQCGKVFAGDYNLGYNRHMETMHNNTKYPCDQCGRNLSSIENLGIHKKTVHDKILRYKCDQCDYLCYSKRALIRHADKHSTVNQHKCDKCKKTFKHDQTLRQHVKQDHENIRHTCDTCGKIFTIKLKLSNHIRNVHKKERNWFCNCCSYSAFARYSFRLHMKTHAEEYEFGCECCYHRFTTEKRLNSHAPKCKKKPIQRQILQQG